MSTASTISYKVYLNERLKPVLFHGQETYPLYIQLIYDRKPLYFKSYFFDLLSDEKYILSGSEKDRYPTVEEVIQKEERLLAYITGKKYATVEEIKADYFLNGFDLLYPMDNGFKEYMLIFFMDEGKSDLGRVVLGARSLITSNGLLKALKGGLKPALYDKLIENATWYAPPYLPLEEFSKKLSKEEFATLSVYEWNDPELQDQFKKMVADKFPAYDYKEIQRVVKQTIRSAV